MNILNSDEWEPPRVGIDRIIDDKTLWRWLTLAYTKQSFFQHDMFEYWSDTSESEYQKIVSMSSFKNDIINFCGELIIFVETYTSDNISYIKNKHIAYAKKLYNKYATSPEIKEPGLL